MRVLESWLRQYIEFSLSPEELAEHLTMLGLEFERIDRLGQKFQGIVVGQVLRCEPHPRADRLRVCSVDMGAGVLSVVCGAPNVAEGQKVPLAREGATVPRNQHDPGGEPLVIRRTDIRGVPSEGMICSEFELELGKDADGILVLDPDATIGQDLAEHLGLNDVAYDIEVTPNRPDWLSTIGIAREIGILVGRRAKLPRPRLKEGPEAIGGFLRVDVEDSEGCPRFSARMVRGVRLAPSPPWMQNALRAVGLRPRNNIVDITNYVMMECGQPMHAFDYAHLSEGRIVVRQAAEGTRFETLDGKGHTLPENTVMVCDSEQEVAIAGIMGGANSEINDATTDVVLEAATWNPSSIRRSAKKLGISTDASQRFERGTDPNGPAYALDRAASLIQELAGGQVLKGRIDILSAPVRPRQLRLRPRRVNRVLGTALRGPTISRYLQSLEIGVRRLKDGTLRCEIPTYRIDIVEEIDLIEEIARVHGYDNIPEKTTAVIQGGTAGVRSSIADRVRSVLTGMGFQEALTNSMQDRWRASLTGQTPAEIMNPLGQEMAWLRTSLAPGLIDSLVRNQAYGATTMRIYEVGHVFRIDPDGQGTYINPYREEEAVCLAMAGSATPHHWSGEERTVDLFDLKGTVVAFLAGLGLDKGNVISYSTSDGLTDGSLRIEIEGTVAGYLGRLRGNVRERFGIKHDVYLAEVALAALDRPRGRLYESLPRYPKVKRDLAFLVDRSVPAERLEATIRESCGALLHALTVFDVYEGQGVESGKRSVAFALELMSRERTLTDAEVEAAIARTAKAMERQHSAVLRTGHEE
jgi:phenylalanyl-tRNA synthetase beta chain